MTDAFDDGFNLFKSEPDLTLTEVWRMKPIKVESFAEAKAARAEQEEFVAGYQAARRQHDAFLQEKRNVDITYENKRAGEMD